MAQDRGAVGTRYVPASRAYAAFTCMPGCTDRYSSQLKKNYFTEMCSGSEAGSYLRLIDFLYHSTLGLREIKKKKRGCGMPLSKREPFTIKRERHLLLKLRDQTVTLDERNRFIKREIPYSQQRGGAVKQEHTKHAKRAQVGICLEFIPRIRPQKCIKYTPKVNSPSGFGVSGCRIRAKRELLKKGLRTFN